MRDSDLKIGTLRTIQCIDECTEFPNYLEAIVDTAHVKRQCSIAEVTRYLSHFFLFPAQRSTIQKTRGNRRVDIVQTSTKHPHCSRIYEKISQISPRFIERYSSNVNRRLYRGETPIGVFWKYFRRRLLSRKSSIIIAEHVSRNI